MEKGKQGRWGAGITACTGGELRVPRPKEGDSYGFGTGRPVRGRWGRQISKDILGRFRAGPQLVDLEDFRIKDVGWSAWKLWISAISGENGNLRGPEQGNFIRKIEFSSFFGRSIPIPGNWGKAGSRDISGSFGTASKKRGFWGVWDGRSALEALSKKLKWGIPNSLDKSKSCY